MKRKKRAQPMKHNNTVSSPLRPYQVQVTKAILDSVLNKKGLSFSVEIAREARGARRAS